jgi:4a-hydroxytetrahydrobiopterin dehydratase
VSTLSKNSLATLHCKPLAAGTPPLQQEQIKSLLQQVEGWIQQDKVISKTFTFNDFHHAMAFVNAVAWLSHREDHHPDLNVGYNKCRVEYTTHAIGGLSENDFICAAIVDALFSI